MEGLWKQASAFPCLASSAPLSAVLAAGRLQAALAGHGVIRVTSTYANAACDSGLLRPVLPDYGCEPLNVHTLLATRQLVPANVRVFLDALDGHGYARPPALADL